MKRYMAWRWWSIALRGVAAIILGLLTLYAPAVTFLSLVIVFGIYAIVDGVLALSIAARGAENSQSMIVVRGLASIIAGVIALVWPGLTAVALLFVIAVWAIVAGILEIAVAIRHSKELAHEWLIGLEGALSLVFGILLLVSPAAGVLTLGIWVGAYALIFGVLLLVAAFRMRSRSRVDVPPTGQLAAT